MAKISLNNIVNTYNTTLINDNFDDIEAEFQNKVLYRNNPVGEPNQMLTNLDMNSKRILNLPAPISPSEPARIQDITFPSSTLINYTPPGTGAILRTQQGKNQESVSVEDYGAVGNGIVDDTAAFTKAITYLLSIGGGRLELTRNSYLLNGVTAADGTINGILIPFTGGFDDGATSTSIEIVGKSKDTKLLAGSNNINLIRLSASYCSIRNLSFFANGKTGVTGLAMRPENLISPNINSQQSFNEISNLYFSKCAEGIVIQCGGNGGAYYNCFQDIHIHGGSQNNTRGIYFKSGTGGANSNANRNQFYSVRFGFLNTAIEIESGDTNSFYGCSAEGVSVGTSPNAIPIAIKILNVDLNARGNELNRFFGFTAEACTADINCLNDRTKFFGCRLAATKSTVGAGFANNGTIIGSYDVSEMPTIEAGVVTNGGNLPTGLSAATYEVGTSSGGQPNVDTGGKFKSFPLSVSNVFNITSMSDSRSYVTKSGKYVDWGARFAVHPTANNSIIRITAPYRAFTTLYSDFSIIPPLEIPIAITAGATKTFATARFNFDATPGTFLEILLPTATLWNIAAGDNNYVQFNIRYREN